MKNIVISIMLAVLVLLIVSIGKINNYMELKQIQQINIEMERACMYDNLHDNVTCD